MSPSFNLKNRVQTSNPELANEILKYYNMDCGLISKMSLEELKNYLRICGLKVNGIKNELVGRVFAASENGVEPTKTAVKVAAYLKTEHLVKLKIDDRNIPDPFKIPHGWMNKNEGMKL